MTLEKPWKKEFESLIKDISLKLEGEIKSLSNFKGEFGARAFNYDNESYFYPSFVGKYKGHSITIENSEFPVSDISSYIDAGGNFEYLRIIITKKTAYNIFISQEGIMDKIQKKIGLISEYETGIELFDKEYLLQAKSDKDKQLLKTYKFQNKIKELEPFTTIKISFNSIQWCKSIHDKSQLSYVEIEKYLDRLLLLDV